MQTLSCCQECIRRLKLHLFDPSMNPAQTRMTSIGKLFSLFNHLIRKVYRVNLLNPFDKLAGDVTTTTSHIQDRPGLFGDESCQKREGGSWIGRTIAIRFYHALILKCRSR